MEAAAPEPHGKAVLDKTQLLIGMTFALQGVCVIKA